MNRKRKVAVIRCSGISLRERMEGDGAGAGDCALWKASYLPGAPGCAYSCLGGGSCVEVCPRHAISLRENGSAQVDRDMCIGCGKCVKICPQQLIELVPTENTIQPFCVSEADGKETRTSCPAGCIGCGICEKSCPSGAVCVTDHHARIDQERCIACGMCAERCPRGVIHDANGIISIR